MSRYTSAELADALRRAGMPQDKIATAVAIAWAESSGEKTAICHDCLGVSEYSVGPWQINLRAHPQVSASCAMNVDCAAQFVVNLSEQGQNFAPWTVFRTGAYQQHLSRVVDEIAGVVGSGVEAMLPEQLQEGSPIHQAVLGECGDPPSGWSRLNPFAQTEYGLCAARASARFMIGQGADTVRDSQTGQIVMRANDLATNPVGTLVSDVTDALFGIGRTLAPYIGFLGLGTLLIIAGIWGLVGTQRIRDSATRAATAVASKGTSEVARAVT